jgi:hypothetical protein
MKSRVEGAPSPVGHQASDGHDHHAVERAVWKRQFFEPAFDESLARACTACRSRIRDLEHGPIRVDADGPCFPLGERRGQQAVSTSEVQDAPPSNRANEIEDAPLLEGFGDASPGSSYATERTRSAPS